MKAPLHSDERRFANALTRPASERGAFRDGACNKGISVFWGLAILNLFVSTLVVAQTDQPGAGIARDLAEWRAANIHDLRCDLRLRIAKLASDPIAGEATLRFTLRDASVPLFLDFAPPANHVRSLVANGEPGHAWVNGHLVIPAPALRVGENVVTIHFTAGDDALNRSDDFLYALFVPARACRALPCFDQPSLKARWTLAVQVPGEAAWHVVSNGALRERVQVDSPVGPGARAALSAARTEFVEYRFAETPPLPTHLFSFVVGDFQVETDERSGRPMRMFHRETDARKVARNRDAIFDLHARSLEYLERYTGIPYMFGKFDFVILPAFQFGGWSMPAKSSTTRRYCCSMNRRRRSSTSIARR